MLQLCLGSPSQTIFNYQKDISVSDNDPTHWGRHSSYFIVYRTRLGWLDPTVAMAILPSLRNLITSHSLWLRPTPPPLPAIALFLSHLSPKSLSLSTLSPKTPTKPHASHNTLVLTKDYRFSEPEQPAHSQNQNQNSTIAAIVTSLGGPPGAVGIVRLSGPSAVSIVSRVFRPVRNKKKKKKKKKSFGSSSWRPISHVVQYGVVLDPHANVLDEVLFFFFVNNTYYTSVVHCFCLFVPANLLETQLKN